MRCFLISISFDKRFFPRASPPAHHTTPCHSSSLHPTILARPCKPPKTPQQNNAITCCVQSGILELLFRKWSGFPIREACVFVEHCLLVHTRAVRPARQEVTTVVVKISAFPCRLLSLSVEYLPLRRHSHAGKAIRSGRAEERSWREKRGRSGRGRQMRAWHDTCTVQVLPNEAGKAVPPIGFIGRFCRRSMLCVGVCRRAFA